MSWMESLFCPKSNLQVLCEICHARKTAKYMQYLTLGVDLL
jgi:hypothetical protein